MRAHADGEDTDRGNERDRERDGAEMKDRERTNERRGQRTNLVNYRPSPDCNAIPAAQLPFVPSLGRGRSVAPPSPLSVMRQRRLVVRLPISPSSSPHHSLPSLLPSLRALIGKGYISRSITTTLDTRPDPPGHRSITLPYLR